MARDFGDASELSEVTSDYLVRIVDNPNSEYPVDKLIPGTDMGSASAISVLDTGNYFTGTNVEAVLAELPGKFAARSTWKHKQTRSFLRNLDQSGRPVSILLMGDSTANGTDEWFYLALDELRASYPAWTFDYRLWNHAAQGWGTATRLQTGTDGDAYHPAGTDARNFKVVDNAAVSVTGDISLRLKLRCANWQSKTLAEAFNKFGAAGNRSFRFQVGSTGVIAFEHSADGTNLLSQTSSAAVSFANNEAGWIRVDLDVNDGAGNHTKTFYTSTNGTDWTQLGVTRTVAGTTSVFDSTADLMICNRGASSTSEDYYAADMYSGIGADNTLVAAWRAGDMYRTNPTAGALTGYDVCGNLWSANSAGATAGITGAKTVNLLNASVTGEVLSYFTDATRFAKLTGSRCRMVMVSLSHNEGGSYQSGDSYRSAFSGLVDQILVVQPDAAVVIVGQNPKWAPSTDDSIIPHRDRVRQLAELAATRDLGFIDAFAALESATYSFDGTHPTGAGSQVWADTALDFLANA